MLADKITPHIDICRTSNNKVWTDFVDAKSKVKSKFIRTYIDRETRLPRQAFNEVFWFRSNEFEKDVIEYFK